MRASLFDRVITIQQNTPNIDPVTNEEVESWANILIDAQVYAQKVEMVGAEEYQADQLVWDKSVKWRIRYRTDLNAEMRITDDLGNVYYITGIREMLGRLPNMPKETIRRREVLELSTEIKDND